VTRTSVSYDATPSAAVDGIGVGISNSREFEIPLDSSHGRILYNQINDLLEGCSAFLAALCLFSKLHEGG
jgi:hypothetical protein